MKDFLDSWLGKGLAVVLVGFCLWKFGLPFYEWLKPELTYWIATIKDCKCR